MPTLRTLLSSEMAAVFLNTDNFAEEIVYYPRRGGSRPINAVVVRNPPAILSGLGEAMQPEVMFTVANSSTTGISSDELDTGGDKISLAIREGEDVRTLVITHLIGHDVGAVRLAAS